MLIRVDRLQRTVVMVSALVVLAACHRAERAAPSGQVAAAVNQSEISVHQVQHVLQRQPKLAARAEAPRLVAESLVEQEIAAQAGREAGLESDPAFVQAMEAAKREILAGLYQDRIAANATRPTSDEVDRYYDSHPALFAARRIFTVQEVQAEVPADAADKVRQAVEAARSGTELTGALDRLGLRYRSGVTVHAPEAVPMRLLERLAKLEEGQSLLVSDPPTARMWTVLKSQPAAVDRQAARQPIETYLQSERRRNLVAARMKELRGTAKVVYAERFAAAPAASASAGTTN
jgi:EpsD family peptidyl-prolyl cis-trans isomerase